jgi:hypothetical protein
VSKNSDNRRRAFADVVAIDAWHDSFGGDVSAVDLHADVVFGTARVGGEADSPVRFRLSVRRAEVIVVIPDSEPVSVDRRSVSRESTESQGKLTEIVEQSTEAHATGGLSASVGATGLSGGISADAGAQANISSTRKLEISANVQFMVVTQSINADGHYRWIVEPRRSRILEGRPWDGVRVPRLKLIDKRKDRSKGIPPTVRVEVCCRREDLVIENLEVKDNSVWEKVKSRAGFANRMAAAESYIRDRLTEEGLDVQNIREIFGELTLGSIMAEPLTGERD